MDRTSRSLGVEKLRNADGYPVGWVADEELQMGLKTT